MNNIHDNEYQRSQELTAMLTSAEPSMPITPYMRGYHEGMRKGRVAEAERVAAVLVREASIHYERGNRSAYSALRNAAHALRQGLAHND